MKKKLNPGGNIHLRNLTSFLLVFGFLVSAVWYFAGTDSAQTGDSTESASVIQEEETKDPSPLDQELTQFTDASSEKNGKWYGLCEKKSIHSLEDFRRTVENDPVLSDYYAGFNWKEAKMGSLDKDVMAYVSHRKGAVIKMTAKVIRLPKGDGYITDGVRTARTYCCNDIDLNPSAGNPQLVESPTGPSSWLPSAPQSMDFLLDPIPMMANEPRSIESLNEPSSLLSSFPPWGDSLSNSSLWLPSASHVNGFLTEPTSLVRETSTLCKCPTDSTLPLTETSQLCECQTDSTFSVPPNSPLAPVPEPSTFILISLGILSFVVIRRKR